MLISALRVLINNPFYKSFDTIFMRNGKKKKKTVKILIVFPSAHEMTK